MRQRNTKRPRREKMIGVKLTTEEYEAVRLLAFEAHKSLGAYIRDRVIPKTTK